MGKFFSEAIKHLKAGRKQDAYTALRLVLQGNPTREEAEAAWFCLAQIVSDSDKKRVCYKKVLSLNPENKLAQKGLRVLEHAIDDNSKNADKSTDMIYEPNNRSRKPDQCNDVEYKKDGKSSSIQVAQAKTLDSQVEKNRDESNVVAVNDPPVGGLAIEGVIALPIFGAVAGATLGAGEIILLAIDILINSGDQLLLNLVLIIMGVIIGAPVVIVAAIILAIVGGIGGFLGSLAIALVCLIVYGLLSVFEETYPLRGVAVFATTVAGFVLLTEFGLNRQIINDFVPLDISYLPLMNNILGALAGVFVGVSLFTISDMSEDSNGVSTEEQSTLTTGGSDDAIGSIWRGYRKIGGGLLDLHDDYLEDRRREKENRGWQNW